MKKIIVLLLCCFYTSIIFAQLPPASTWAGAGLPWSKDCSLKPKTKFVIDKFKGTDTGTACYCIDDEGYSQLTPCELATTANCSKETSISLTQTAINKIVADVADLEAKGLIQAGGKIVIRLDPSTPLEINEIVTLEKDIVIIGPGIISICNSNKIILKDGCGIENVTINNSSQNDCCQTSGGGFSIVLDGAVNSWVKGVTSNHGGTKGHIGIIGGSSGCEISGNKIANARCHSDMGGGRAYGIFLAGSSNNNLVFNNYLTGLRHHILIEDGAFLNVISNNTCVNTIAYNFGDNEDLCKQNILNPVAFLLGLGSAGQIEVHGGAGGQNLIEGNSTSSTTAGIKYFEKDGLANTGGDVLLNNTSTFSNTTSILWIRHTPSTPIIVNGVTLTSTLLIGTNLDDPIPTNLIPINPFLPSSLYFTGIPPTEQKKPYVRCSITPYINNVDIEPNLYFIGDIYACTVNEAGDVVAGSIDITIVNGEAPFEIDVNGSTTIISNDTYSVRIPSPGLYTIKIRDSKGTSLTRSYTIDECDGKTIVYKNIQNNPDNAIGINISSNRDYSIDNTSSSPENFDLKAFPNPSNDVMTIQYDLVQEDNVSLSLVNNYGQIVKVLETNVSKQAGRYEVQLKKEDLPTGMYFGLFRSKYNNKTFKVIFK